MLRSFLLCLFALVALPASAQDFPGLFHVTGVASNDVLNIRAEPSAQSAIVGALSYTQTGVEVVGLSQDRRWGLVQNGDGAGWVSMRFMTRSNNASWQQGEVAMTCRGTEPFWSLNLFFPTNRAEFLGPDDSFEIRTTAPFMQTTYHPLTLATFVNGAREGMIVIRQGVCSDGMSDQVFGLETQIYWQNEPTGLSGCCSLTP